MTELREKLNNIVEEKNTKIIPENLKSGVEAFGIQGTFTSDATAAPTDIVTGKTAYVNGQKIIGEHECVGSDNNASVRTVVTLESSSGTAGLNTLITKLPENIVVNAKSAAYLFYNCSALEDFPVNLDTTGVTNMQNMFAKSGIREVPADFKTSTVTNAAGIFSECPNLVTVPKLDLSKVTGTSHSSMFYKCPNLSNESLDNILWICTNLRSISGNQNYRTLRYIGLTQEQAEICLTLPNYSRLNWDTGY